MRLLTWLIRIVLFVVMLGFALSNTDSVSLQFFGVPEFSWRAPLVLFLLIFFAAGALLGALSSMPTVLRQRRQIGQLRKQTARVAASAQAAAATAESGSPSAQPAVVVRESGIRSL
jgi:lipopolysaccharide assembly protein A